MHKTLAISLPGTISYLLCNFMSYYFSLNNFLDTKTERIGLSHAEYSKKWDK